MRIFLYRLAGFLLIAGAVVGLLLSALGIYFLWKTKDSVTRQLVDDSALISRSLHTTSDGLSVVGGALTNARNNLRVVQISVNNVARSIDEMDPSVQQMSTLVGYDLPSIVTSTRHSLSIAANNAKLVDDTLRVISAIPFIGARYKPDVPLQNTVNDVSNSLQYLPDSLMRIQAGIKTAGTNLQMIKGNIYELSGNLNRFDISLQDAQSVVKDYQAIVQPLTDQADKIQNGLPGFLNGFYLVTTLVLGWLVLVQIAMFFQGLSLLTKE